MEKDIIEWGPEFNIGVEEIDNAHRQLFSIVKRLIRMVGEGDPARSVWVCEEAVKYLKDYTIRHFAQEEAYQKKISYPGYEMHKRLHSDLRDIAIPALEKELKDTDFSAEAVQHFTGMCLGWLTAHIMLEDMAITGKARSRFSSGMDIDRRYDLEDAVDLIMRSTFNLKAGVENRHYSGFETGDSFIFNLIAENDSGRVCDAVVILEDCLLLSTVGEMLSVDFDRMDKIVVSATIEICHGMIEKGMELMYPEEKGFRIISDRVFDISRLRKKYSSGFPADSILFRTEKGRFALCLDIKVPPAAEEE